MVKDFFKLWFQGMKSFLDSQEGSVIVNLVFSVVVVVGLVGGSVQRFLQGDVWMFLVLFGFSFIMGFSVYRLVCSLLDLRLSSKRKGSLKGFFDEKGGLSSDNRGVE